MNSNQIFGNHETSADLENFASLMLKFHRRGGRSSNELPIGKSRLAIWGTFWSAIDIMIPTLVGFLVFILTSRYLSPSDFGVVALAGGVALFGSSLCPAGFGTALVQKLEIDRFQLDVVFWFCLGSGILIYLLEVILAPTISRLFKLTELATLIPVMGTRILAEMIAVVPNALISKSLSFRIFAIRTLFVSLLAAGISVGLLFAGFGIWALVASQIVVAYVNALAGFLAVKWRPGFSFRKAAFASLAHYGVYASATRGMGQLIAQNELFFVGFLLGATEVGVYNFAKRLFTILNDVVSGALASVAHPLLSGVQDDLARTKRAFLLATFISSTIAFPLFVGLAVLADRIIPLLFGVKWTSAIELVRLQCALGMVACIGVLQAALITSRGKAAWWFYYQLFSSATTFGIIATLAAHGAEAMLAGIVLKSYLIFGIPVSLTLRLTSMDMKEYLFQFWSPILASVLMAVAIYLVRGVTSEFGDFHRVATDLITGTLVYLSLIWTFERSKLTALFRLIVPLRVA